VKLGRDSATFLRENLEAFAIAIAMALVIRHFCVEAFRIPTDSMRPTLNGEDAYRRRHGDRILVDKFAYLVRDPRRFEVAVFQYPLNRNNNFIKRILGLPGEWLRIADGDVWISTDRGATWRIARKPPGVEDQLFLPFYPAPIDDEGAFLGHRNWEADRAWSIDETRRRFSVDADAGGGVLSFRHPVPPYDHRGGIGAFRPEDDVLVASMTPVGDVRVSFRIALERTGTLAVRLREHGRTHELRLAADGARIVAEGEESDERELPFRLARGEHEISFANVDGTLVAVLDGERTRLEIPGETEGEPRLFGPEPSQHGISIEATDLRAELSDLSIDRDVYYLPANSGGRDPWEVPEGHYMMLGDNSGNSADSRGWYALEAKLKDGTLIRWEGVSRNGVFNPDSSWKSAPPDTVITIQEDVDGVLRRFRRGEAVDAESGRVPISYVPRSNLIGRAFSVFWPIFTPGIYSGPTRVKLIR